MIPWSFPNAIALPENETLPMMSPSIVLRTAPQLTALPVSIACVYSRIDTSAAEPPPAPLNSATICGMAVIFTRRPPATPATAPTAIPPAVSAIPAPPYFWNSAAAKVNATARSMPAARPLLEHAEHPVGDDEAADDVRRPEHHPEEPEDHAERSRHREDDEHRAH